MEIRSAVEDDLPAIARLYDEQVRSAVTTFDLDPPGPDAWAGRVANSTAGDHFLVAEHDAAVLGFAYSSTYRPRPGYRHTRETSVYLDSAARGSGLGRVLYDDLLDLLRADGMRTVVAVVALPNPASRALHEACGFILAGVLPEVGRKFDRWIDTELWVLSLA